MKCTKPTCLPFIHLPQLFSVPSAPFMLSFIVSLCVYAVFPTLPVLNCLPVQLHVESKLLVI